MTRKTAFYTDELTFWHHAAPHALIAPTGGWVQVPSTTGLAESPETKRRLKSLLDASGLGAEIPARTAPMLERADLLRVHGAAYLDRLEQASAQGFETLGPSAPVGPGTYDYARLSAGLVAGALDAVLSEELDNAYALSRPPGHHCLPDEAMGFCFLANIPLAIEKMKAERGLGRVAVIDWDVHHGNGTQAIYEHRDDVLTVSLHQENCFPPGYSGAEDRGRDAGEGFNINVPLPAGAGHAAYLRAMERIVVPALDAYAPEIIVIASGYDAGALDPLARMSLTSESYRAMTRMMRASADRLCGGRLVVAHEGGYSEAYVPFCGLAVIEELAERRSRAEDPLCEFMALQQPSARHQAFLDAWVDDLAASVDIARLRAGEPVAAV